VKNGELRVARSVSEIRELFALARDILQKNKVFSLVLFSI
jgi:hypothetical protein